jgi:hypothetical protein
MTHDGVTTIWGKNGSNQVYYLACPTDQLSLPGSWSIPVPIISGIERISAFVNRTDGGNTIFASGGGKLQKLTQATNLTARVWRAEDIKLAAAPTQKSSSLTSYTTVVQVVDKDGLPAKGVTLDIAANSRTAVYMNGLYYVLGLTPVKFETDMTGTVTIIEATDDINSAVYSIG